jgi:ketosteroid isomerase-like protein
MELFELIARESIRDLVQRYNANGDSGRFDPMLALFAEDATMELPNGTFQGRAAIRAMFESVAERTGAGKRAAYIPHNTSTHQSDVHDENTASGRCYYFVITDSGLDHWGRYIDEYRRIDGQWRFWHRRVTSDGAVENAWAETAQS